MSEPRTPGTLERWGTASWRAVGIALAFSIGYGVIVSLSGLVVPLLLAVVIGALAVPAVDRMERIGVPRQLGALIFIALLLVVLAASFAVVVRGIVQESGEITEQVTAGVDAVDSWLDEREVDVAPADEVVDGGTAQGRPLLTGAASWATTVFSGAMAFAIGVFLALFMLYYILVDWDRLRLWLGQHLGVEATLGAAIIDDATRVVRRGFGALTINSLITSILIGLTMVLLDLPLAAAVAVVTFVTSYVPYLGAILSGTFGALIALGAGGPQDALVLLVVILVVQNIVQTIVGNRLASDRLQLHPLPSIISSVAGVAIAGLIGAMLSAPALALAISVNRRVRWVQADLDADGGTGESGVAPGPGTG